MTVSKTTLVLVLTKQHRSTKCANPLNAHFTKCVNIINNDPLNARFTKTCKYYYNINIIKLYIMLILNKKISFTINL